MNDKQDKRFYILCGTEEDPLFISNMTLLSDEPRFVEPEESTKRRLTLPEEEVENMLRELRAWGCYNPRAVEVEFKSEKNI